MTFTVRNITELDNVISMLIIEGYSDSEIHELTKLFHDDASTMDNVEYLISSKRLDISQCLSQEWIVSKLKSLVEGQDPIAAVKALKVLSELSEKRRSIDT
ncbi:hypothetical protein [Providencia huaxiensis]|uniref:hypothetical protein n=1 Tax=Providencia huaxiensis TaxID=2027290 RepID=UPI00189F6A39|nr:hypothetical protein [Providencia rettgeri]QPE15855.1 hypothetical protein IMQ36_11650 [Providencia rettgeri]